MRIDGLQAYGISTFLEDLNAGSNFLLAQGVKVPGGTSTQYLMADGSLSEDLGGSVPVYEGTIPGLVPTGQDGTSKYLREDGSWVTPPNTWRGIDNTPVNGQTSESISSNWAYDHAASSTAHPRDTRSQIAGTYNNTIGTSTDLNTAGATVIDEILLSQGVITSLTTRQLAKSDLGIVDVDNYVNSATFSTSNGILTLGRTGGLGNVTVDLDGRFALTSDLPGVFTGSAAGLVPSALAGDATLFLRGDGIWAEAQGSSGGDGNNYPTSLTFNTSNGFLSLGRSGLTTLSVSMDGRYALSSHTHSYDNYLSWLIYIDNVYKAPVTSSSRVTFNAGTNMSLDYSGTNKTITFNAGASEDKFVDGVSFNTGTGVLSISRNGGLADVTTDLDGRYLQGNQTINVTGDVLGSGTTAISVTAQGSIITGKSAITSGLASTDEFLLSDSGTLKRMDVSVLQSYMQSSLDFGDSADGNNYPNSLSFSTSTGVLTLGRDGLTALTVDLDNRYLLTASKAADSEKLDGIDSAEFLRSNVTDYKTIGALGFYDNVILQLGTGADVEHYWNGSNYYTDINNGGNWYIRDGNSSNATRFTLDADNGGFLASGTVQGATIVKTGGTSDQILLADGTTVSRNDVGSSPGTSTSTSYTKDTDAASVTVHSFRASRYGDVVTVNVKSSGSMTAVTGRVFITILDANFIPSEDIYFIVSINYTSGEGRFSYMKLNTAGQIVFEAGSDNWINDQRILLTFIKRDD